MYWALAGAFSAFPSLHGSDVGGFFASGPCGHSFALHRRKDKGWGEMQGDARPLGIQIQGYSHTYVEQSLHTTATERSAV